MAYHAPTALTPATPPELARYRERHQIAVVTTEAGNVCAYCRIPVIRRGFYGWLHHPDEIRRMARIERGGEA